ncbi:unnamed protein product [Cylicocyclus nassatus]|uniref:Uncharacterized protein n=1 Tax=Cylicocyclus nassatus TaxID=53992 RepID=A0AA36MAW9_CYLNA|nr:unnamed protein product [Cylicocyclus nassatus]
MLVILLSLVAVTVQQQWTSEDYPNPRKDGFKQCKMRSRSNICDPDELFDESGRYRLNHELMTLSQRTESTGNTFCTKKGMDAVLAITRQGSQELANGLRDRWRMDDQCQKSAVFLLSADNRQLYFAPQPGTPLNDAEFQAILASNSMQLQAGEFLPALVNIFKEIGKKTDVVGPEPPTPVPPYKRASPITIFVSIMLALLLSF